MLDLGSLDFLRGGRLLITGGTGSLGRKLVDILLGKTEVGTVVIFSRDEFKQYEVRNSRSEEERARLRFFIGDVRDGDRLKRAFEGVDWVVHAAALKQIPAAEYNPFEFVKTNVEGAKNVIDAAIDVGVKRVVALSSDKAVNPVNLYGATKLCSEKLFVSSNSYSGSRPARFSAVRYGNVIGSRGSVVPFFLRHRNKGFLPVTDRRMTRFWLTLDQSAALVLNALRDMIGGEIWVPKIPSMRMVELARVVAPECEQREVGIRPGEKLHEMLISSEDAPRTVAFEDHFVVEPVFPWWDSEWHAGKGGTPCQEGFCYDSEKNSEWLQEDRLAEIVAALDLPEAREWARDREEGR